MRLEHLQLDDLTLDPKNTRRHDDRNVEAIAASLKEFGQQRPIVVTTGDHVVAGNGTVLAARSLGWDSIDAVRTDLSSRQLSAYAVADNRTAELAEWDEPNLAAILADLQAADAIDETTTGFTADEIEALTQSFRTGDAGMPDLPSGDRSPFRQMAFILHDTQAEVVSEALKQAKAAGPFVDPPNENGNGNALARIVEFYIANG